MEPPEEVIQDLNSKLDSTLRKIISYVGHANEHKETLHIENLGEFVFGMVYQAYFKKCVDYHVKYAQENNESGGSKPVLDLSGIGEKIFETRSNEIRQLINAQINSKIA